MPKIYHCGKYNKDLTKKELNDHGCFSRKKGHKKGKKCDRLVVYYEE